ncbi:MAG: 16S rRNA (guanine(527)-N(7))-methyltransferase RsmG [Chloroflexota bacterium]
MTTSPSRLAAGAAALGLALDDAQLALLSRYATLLVEGARAFNLTTITEPEQIEERHFLDSLSVTRALPAGAITVLDVGSGAGFPGIPLKIARPNLDLTLLDATGKKVAWLTTTVRELGLQGIVTVAERAETLAHDPSHRGRYDVSVARAVAPLAALCELCLPFIRPGGVFVAPKSQARAMEELPAAARSLDLLGGRVVDVLSAGLDSMPNRVLVLIEKVGDTAAAYPRRPGMPTKRPL